MLIIIKAITVGIGVLLAGNLPWATLLAPLNLRFITNVPWAVVPMGGYLWIYWKYVTGALGSPSTAMWRRQSARATRCRVPFGPSRCWRVRSASQR